MTFVFMIQGSIQDHGQRDGRRPGHGHHGSYLQEGFCQRGGAGESNKGQIISPPIIFRIRNFVVYGLLKLISTQTLIFI